MEESLALPRATGEVAAPAIFLHLRDVAPDGAPALDLALVIGTATAKIIAAIPLKPAARIFLINPAFRAPDRRWQSAQPRLDDDAME